MAVGRDIFFREGGTTEGQRILADELVHSSFLAAGSYYSRIRFGGQ